MMYRSLIVLLATEHWSRYGTAPTGPHWLYQPWVTEFLHCYDPPRATAQL